MADNLEKSIRERAYEIWQEEGCPAGREGEHWEQARAEMAAARAEQRETVSAAPAVPTKAKSATSRPPRARKSRA